MITPDLSYEQYDALPGFNSSLLKIAANQSLLHAKAYLDGFRKESDALDFGTSFHELLLRGERDFVTRPETYPAPAKHAKVKSGEISEGDPLPWNAGAQVCKDWISANARGRKIMDEEETKSLEGMVAAVRSHPDLAPYLAGRSEVAVTAERRGLPYKALVDLLPDDLTAPVIDFKKTRSANPRVFVADALKHGYHLQAALNLDVLAWNGQVREHFWFVAVEDIYPHAVWIMKLQDTSPSLIRMGRAKYLSAVALVAGAQKSGNWPAYPADVQPEALVPAWMIAELDKT